jgi:hypothetical protein
MANQQAAAYNKAVDAHNKTVHSFNALSRQTTQGTSVKAALSASIQLIKELISVNDLILDALKEKL